MKDEIIKHAARAFFACAWADLQEEMEDGVNLLGCEILEVMPQEIPKDALEYATELVNNTERSNGTDIETLLAKAAKHSNGCDRDCDAEHFGHYLAIHAMGSGVGLESVTTLDIEVPYAEDYEIF